MHDDGFKAMCDICGIGRFMSRGLPDMTLGRRGCCRLTSTAQSSNEEEELSRVRDRR